MDQKQIAAELASKRKAGAVVERLGGLNRVTALLTGRAVPEEIRAVVKEGFTTQGFGRHSALRSKRGTFGEALSSLSDNDWTSVVETLLPHVASSATSACRILTRRPYQEGIARRPFRAPRAPRTLADTRARWLVSTTFLIGEYDADIRWIAEWAVPLSAWTGATDLGWLFAGAIDVGDDTANDVYRILESSALGEHDNGQMGRHVTQAFMSCARPEAWAFVERLLLSAQRQEGLRHVILESVDESHPEAFRRMLRLIREENLSRFSSVVRAADTWFGFLWDGASTVKIDRIIDRVSLFLDDASARRAALDESDAETVYLALWSIAFDDVNDAIEPAKSLLGASSPELRFVATHFLAQTVWTSAVAPLVGMIADEDLRVAIRALDAFGAAARPSVDGARVFELLEGLFARVPERSKTLGSIVWPWTGRTLERPTIAAALANYSKSVDAVRFLPYVPSLQPNDRVAFVRRAAGLELDKSTGKPSKPRTLEGAERTVVLELMGDASPDVRAIAFQAMKPAPILPDEIDLLVEYLGRKPGDLRSACITRIGALADAEFFAVVDRLLDDAEQPRRVAGLELLRDASEKNRDAARAKLRVQRYVADHTEIAEDERAHIDFVLGERQATPTTDDALGLISRSRRDWPRPKARNVPLDTPGARASLDALARVVIKHAATEFKTPNGETKLLIESSALMYGPMRADRHPADEDIPLVDVWRRWVEARTPRERDADGFELVRALLSERSSPIWQSDDVRKVVALGRWSAGETFLRGTISWCLAWSPPAGAPAFLVEGLEGALAELSDRDYAAMTKEASQRATYGYSVGAEKEDSHLQKLAAVARWVRRLRWWRDFFPSHFRIEDHERFYNALRGYEHRSNGRGVLRAGIEEFLPLYDAGKVDTSEFIDLLAGRQNADGHVSLLKTVSTRKPPRELAKHPELLDVVDTVRRRIIEIETQRGDRPTAASSLAIQLRATGGLETLTRAVSALGSSHFARSFRWSGTGDSRQETLSHLVVRSVPAEGDTFEAFATWAKKARISETRLVELAMYAPQWAGHINHLLQWPGLESGIWWIEAHTKDGRSWSLQEMKELWAAEVSERTPLSAGDLTEGAVDVEWFRAAHAELGAKRWAALDKAAKYAASSAGHTRAQLFSRTMMGLETRDALMKRIDASRHQDAVRALGLLPLAEGDAGRDDVLSRYVRLQEFIRQARKFGSQRQASEKRAAAIGLENLARTAGFGDPQRLQWAMEQRAVADLAEGPVVVVKGDVRLELSIDADGDADLSMKKNDKTLKTLPAALKMDADVAELKERLQALKRQKSRVRDVLEGAMIRGDQFHSSELPALMAHPILAPALSRIVFVGDDIAGYLDRGGRVLRDQAGSLHPLGNNERLRVAHPFDLFANTSWAAWQRECFRAERVQPFKQLFRELYPLTDSERGTERTRRFAGHQVNPRQALALLGGRGWVARAEEGVSRTFHESGITARLGFEEAFFTPADIEGLTLDEVIFTKKGEFKPLALTEIPARLFSEAMRDLDLVVSVAHRGGVDPEATASTVEMRAALVVETCRLLNLTNVEMKTSHAIVTGKLGTYSIHLGSAGTMLLPSTALPIVAVHSQHRGRLFLPFADDDPRTAEVLSKVLLLARDSEIRDPSILKWIQAAQHGSPE